jgi:hypothetical protein
MRINNKEYNDWLVLGVIAVIVMAFTGWGPIGEWAHGATDDATQTFVSSGTDVDQATSTASILSLDSGFTDLTAEGYTIADSDTNFNEDTNTVSFQVDAEVSDDGTNTTFTIKSKDTDGSVQTLATITESGILSEPSSDLTADVSVNMSESVLGGFDSTDQVLYSTVSASATRLKDDSGEYFYPVTTGSDSTKPLVKIDGTEDEKQYSWTADSSAIAPQITFSIDWSAINDMDDISDEVQIPVEMQYGDDTPITVELIKNSAI